MEFGISYITQNLDKMQKSFFNFSSILEELENNFKQVSQNFSDAKEQVLNLAVNSENLAGKFLNYHPNMCIV
ncbi:hypothetical protein [Wolbachia endosymbiont (group B) of Agrotis puta]|uniref:hypothetical protein n=1 Tax=Wolbachia endosymbiont (group B) of Agrotis puta TaxID=3066162 RepID=UPI00333E91BB